MSLVNAIITELDRGLKAITTSAASAENLAWLKQEDEKSLDKQLSIALMRINHVGEVCAQALYYGQSVVTKDLTIKEFLLNSAKEEKDHLLWCKQRINELGGRVSYLNFFWYVMSFGFGVAAGCAGDKWGLGFVQTTEMQVEQHLKSHLVKLPEQDKRSRVILEKMVLDELGHAHKAQELGAKEVPKFLQNLMQKTAKVMTAIAYWV
jgi:ubiquinone biosynthesis monooxygenase Coq7